MTAPAVFLPFLVFCVVMTGTPGPNNAMALTSGVRVGLWRSMPLVCGVALGVGGQLAAVGLGLGAVFRALPILHEILRLLGTAYLFWLAYRIARSGPIEDGGEEKAPIGLVGGALFQWINPKAWAVTTSAVAIYVPAQGYAVNVAIAALALGLVAVLTVGLWAAGGVAVRRLLVNPGHVRWFNLAMAALLVLSTVPILLGSSAA